MGWFFFYLHVVQGSLKPAYPNPPYLEKIGEQMKYINAMAEFDIHWYNPPPKKSRINDNNLLRVTYLGIY